MSLFFVTSPFWGEQGKYIKAWTHKQAVSKREGQKVRTCKIGILPCWMVVRVDREGTDENGRIYCRDRKFRHYVTV